jgi:copper chaperone CopZ
MITQAKVYAIQLSGISCTNCVAAIKKILTEQLHDSSAKISVNVMSEKVTLTVYNDATVGRAIDILKGTKFLPVAEPLLISGNTENHRSIGFLIPKVEVL